jgi:hypothetical protein
LVVHLFRNVAALRSNVRTFANDATGDYQGHGRQKPAVVEHFDVFREVVGLLLVDWGITPVS